MNKRALALKQKRREARIAEKNAKLNELWDNVMVNVDENKRASFPKTQNHLLQVQRLKNDISSQVLNKSAVLALLCALNILYEQYDFNTEDLIRYSKRLRNFILMITSNNKSFLSIVKEIENGYNVKIVERCKDLPLLTPADFKKYNMQDAIIKSTVDNFYYFAAVNAYTFMNDLLFNSDKSWNSEDLELFISESFRMYKNILNDTSYMYFLHKQLCTKCYIDVDLNKGNIREIIKQ